jgi:hypothetical protein
MTRLRLPAAAVALLVASTGQADLRTFDVDPQYQQEVFAALTDILTPDPQRGLIMEAHGRVELLPSGQILVNADSATLDQVEQVLQAIRTRPSAPTPRASLRYWAVLGALNPADPEAVGAPPPPVLNEVIAELTRMHGERVFRVLGSAALTTASGQAGELDAATLSIDQLIYVQGNTLNAEISMELKAVAPPPMVGLVEVGGLALHTTLQRGDFVVLGESEVQTQSLRGPIFYIVHWAE